MKYKIIGTPSWQVQRWHKGKWVTAFYCTDENAAIKCKADCIRDSRKWASMSDGERMKAILR